MTTFPSSNSLIGVNYTLIPFSETDVTVDYVGWLNDPEITKFLEVRHTHQTLESAAEYIKGFYVGPEQYIWGIYPIEHSKPIGTLILSDLDRFSGAAALGLMIGVKDYWGKGASKEAVELVCDLAFGKFGLRRVNGATSANNHGMNFTFRRVGFSVEGILRESCLLPDLTYADTYIWGLLKDEWISPIKIQFPRGNFP